MNSKSDVIIIGGGASGLVAAIVAARLDRSVTILEHKEKIGKKLLATGNGKCNYTNRNQQMECYRGDDSEFVVPILKQFGLQQTLDFFQDLGIYPKEKNGYFYPFSEQASSVLEVLSLELAYLKVKVKGNEHVIGITKEKEFHVMTSTYTYLADTVILATGGCSSKVLGSDGSGYDIAKALGHHITPLVPALTSLCSKKWFFKDLAGARIEAVVELYEFTTLICKEKGEVQFTNYGISGIPVFQISRFAGKALNQKKPVSVVLDFMPEVNGEQLHKLFWKRCQSCGYRTIEEQFIGLLNRKLGAVIIKEAGLKGSSLSSQLTKDQIMEVTKLIKHFPIQIDKTNSFENSQVTAGGIVTKEINPETLESNLVPGLFFCGEIIDIDGTCGGYNLQWAWSSGYVAGKNVGK